jgi:hypothetical protein
LSILAARHHQVGENALGRAFRVPKVRVLRRVRIRTVVTQSMLRSWAKTMRGTSRASFRAGQVCTGPAFVATLSQIRRVLFSIGMSVDEL